MARIIIPQAMKNFILSTALTALYEFIIDWTMKLNAESNKVSINAT